MLSEQQLDKGIRIAGILLIITVLVFGGVYYKYRLSYALHNQNIVDQQINKLETLVDKNRQNVNYRLSLAQAYLLKNRFQDAVGQFNQVLKIKKGDPTSTYYLGFTYYQMGDKNKALTYFGKEIGLASGKQYQNVDLNLRDAYFYSAKIFEDNKDFDKAIADFNKAAKIGDADSDTYFELGQCFAGKNDYKKAIENYQNAIKFVPNYAEAYYGLGQAYEKQGQNNQAIAQYEKALKYKPNYSDAKDALSSLKGAK